MKYLTVEKITYLILIDYYCDNAKSDQTLVISIEQQKSLTNLLLFLHDQVNCTKNLKHFKSLNDILVELNDISNKYTLTEVSLYLLFQLKKCTSSSEEFINLFKRIIDLIENPESSSPNDASVFPTLLIERNSPFGLFLRRCVLDFNNLLLENLVDFQNRFMIPYFKNLNLKLFQNLSREELNNLNSIKFLNNDGEEIEENIIEDVFPKLVVKSEVNPTDEFLVYDDCFKYVEKLVEMLEILFNENFLIFNFSQWIIVTFDQPLEGNYETLISAVVTPTFENDLFFLQDKGLNICFKKFGNDYFTLEWVTITANALFKALC
ncbi:hypothetical protein HK099_007496 [Clydaea vesicula]|uniref:Uncharacterized protein n=1 Tax=Clydaea vesicula TaxID=447962 RepID=A0AAD5Y0K8_9FUNG|nr:hypothetical protein HK099_007496 [Clydaea vesicula]